MENRNTNWLDQRLAALTAPPNWQPNAADASVRMRARIQKQHAPRLQPGLRWVGAAALGCAALTAVPQTRVIAEQAWQFLTANRVEVVHVDLAALPEEAKSLRDWSVSGRGAANVVTNVQEIAAQTGFTPLQPRPGVVSGTPKLAVMGPLSFSTTIQLKDVQLALNHAGIRNQNLPAAWDGASLAMHFSPVAISEWQGATLMELKPPVLSTPAGFDVPRFTSLTLRAAGLAEHEAEQVAARVAAAPAVVLGIDADDPITVRDVQLRSGLATLIHDESPDANGDRVTLVWSMGEHMFVISTAFSEEFAIRLAEALHQ